MKYLVSMESIETGLLPFQQMAGLIEQTILPGLETVQKLEKEKKVLGGGVLAGKRKGVVIIEAASNEELDQILTSLPFWGLMKVEVSPLMTFSQAIVRTRESLKQIKEAAGN